MLNRLSVYEALGVPEIWRWTRKGHLVFLERTSSGCQERERSSFFSTIPPAAIEELIGLCFEMSILRWKRNLREWVRQLGG